MDGYSNKVSVNILTVMCMYLTVAMKTTKLSKIVLVWFHFIFWQLFYSYDKNVQNNTLRVSKWLKMSNLTKFQTVQYLKFDRLYRTKHCFSIRFMWILNVAVKSTTDFSDMIN